jgi:hypothetical protein
MASTYQYHIIASKDKTVILQYCYDFNNDWKYLETYTSLEIAKNSLKILVTDRNRINNPTVLFTEDDLNVTDSKSD